MMRARTRTTSRKRAGFTLIELMMAIVMRSIGLLGMAGLMVSSTQVQQLSTTRSQMTLVAESKLEELRSYGQTAAADPLRLRLNVGGSMAAPSAGYADSVQAPGGRWYYRRWQISNDIAGMRRVDLRVVPQYDDRYVPRQVQFTTLVAVL
jgi:prepilin-type N-terminal cleavage/methylation domain-containing protein